MRHHNANRKFGRTRDARRALLRSLACSLILEGKIKTTIAKAKELRPFVERLVTRAKGEVTLHHRRLLQQRTGSEAITSRLIKEVAPKYKERRGGYTRISKLSDVRKDGASLATIEFV